MKNFRKVFGDVWDVMAIIWAILYLIETVFPTAFSSSNPVIALIWMGICLILSYGNTILDKLNNKKEN